MHHNRHKQGNANKRVNGSEWEKQISWISYRQVMAHNIILADLSISAPSLFEKTFVDMHAFLTYMQDAFYHSELLYGWSMYTFAA